MKNTEVVDATDLAAAAGVSRRTILRAAERQAAIVYLGNKGYVSAADIPLVLGKRYDPSVAKTGRLEAGEAHLTLQQVAAMLKCSRSTVLRVLGRTGLGVKIGDRRYIPRSQVASVRAAVLKPGVTTIQLDPERMRDHARKMAAASARVRKQAAKIRHR